MGRYQHQSLAQAPTNRGAGTLGDGKKCIDHRVAGDQDTLLANIFFQERILAAKCWGKKRCCNNVSHAPINLLRKRPIRIARSQPCLYMSKSDVVVIGNHSRCLHAGGVSLGKYPVGLDLLDYL